MHSARKAIPAAILVGVVGLALYQTRDRTSALGTGSHPESSVPGPSTAAAGTGGKPQQASTKSFLRPRLDDAGLRDLAADPRAALNRYDTEGAWTGAADDLLVAWAAKNPEAALAWVRTGEHAANHAQLLGAVGAGILLRDGKEAMQRFLASEEENPKLAPKDQGTLEQRLFYHLGREDSFEAALEILAEHKEDGLAGALVSGIGGYRAQAGAIDYLEAKGHEVPMDYWSFQGQISEDPNFWADWAFQRDSDLLEDILQSWTREHPAETRAWIDRTIPQDDKRRAEIEEIYKLQTTPATVDADEEDGE